MGIIVMAIKPTREAAHWDPSARYRFGANNYGTFKSATIHGIFRQVGRTGKDAPNKLRITVLLANAEAATAR